MRGEGGGTEEVEKDLASDLRKQMEDIEINMMALGKYKVSICNKIN